MFDAIATLALALAIPVIVFLIMAIYAITRR